MKLTTTDLQNVAVGYVCLWAIAPFMAYGDVYRLIVLLAVGVWALLELARPGGGILLRPTVPVLIAALYIAYTAVTEMLLGYEGDVVQHIQVWILLFFLVFYESRRKNVRSMEPIFWLVLATLPVWLYTTYSGIDAFGSHAARLQTRSSEVARELSSAGVGGYSLVYGTVLMLPVVAMLLINSSRFLPIERPAWLRSVPVISSLVRVLLLATLVLGTLVVLRAGYSIAIVLAVSCLALSVFFKKRSPVFLFLVPLIGVSAYIFFDFALIPLLKALAPATEGTPYYRKILDIVATLQSDQSQGTAADRVERYRRSFELFLANPLFGVISDADVGKHSAYLDAFARYGVFVGSAFVYLMLYLPVRMMKAMRDNFGLALGVFGLMLLLPLLNDVFGSLGALLFIVTPVACELVERKAAPVMHTRKRRPLFLRHAGAVGPRGG